MTLTVTLEYWNLIIIFLSPVFCWNFGITKFTHIVEKHFKAFFMQRNMRVCQGSNNSVV